MNMKKRLALVLVLIMMASAATTALASPFADVPADHWAYDSVAELAAAGLIEGYPDGTYGGARMMTRYEAAMVFARALHRLEGQIAANNLLPELDKIKAELMAEIEAKMAAADKPVVETIETKVIEQRIDEQALARIRANEIAIDAMEGDMAYLEARMLGLIDGIRYDMNLLEEQHATGVEAPSMDEIEALIAARIQESLLDVASGVKETTIVERVVSTTPELTRQDVELIAEALIRQQVSEVERTVQENRDLIIGLVEWVDELDSDVRVLKDDVAGLKTSVAQLEKAPVISGDLTMKAEYKAPEKDADKGYVPTMSGNLNLNIKASETTDVKAILGYSLDATESLKPAFSQYRVEVKSETPVSRVVVGKLPNSVFGSHDFSGYVLSIPSTGTKYGFGGLARVDIIDDLTLDLFAGQTTPGHYEDMTAAAALKYAFMPEIGIKLTGKLDKPAGAMFKNYAAGIGLFGEVVGVTYTGDFAMDFAAKEKNYLAVVTAKTTFEPVTIDGKFIYQEAGYKVTNQLVDAKRKFGVEGGLAAKPEFAGFKFDLAARAYYEGGALETDNVGTVLAFKADASATYEDFFVPVTLSASYIGNKTGDDKAEFRHHAMAKLAIEQKADYGLSYGASAAYVKNILDNDVAKGWRNVEHIKTDDQVQLNANLGYGLDWSGAKVDLGYKAAFVLTTQPEDTKPSTLTHNVDVGYGFTEDVKLTFGGSVKQTFSEPAENAFGYNAGLTVKF
ncbi:MAG: S-layer homology domain-containing protein [Firmicutes bacterium]|nr:S-layer homology domain-containing protein [Bacillota bacterium]